MLLINYNKPISDTFFKNEKNLTSEENLNVTVQCGDWSNGSNPSWYKSNCSFPQENCFYKVTFYCCWHSNNLFSFQTDFTLISHMLIQQMKGGIFVTKPEEMVLQFFLPLQKVCRFLLTSKTNAQ